VKEHVSAVLTENLVQFQLLSNRISKVFSPFLHLGRSKRVVLNVSLFWLSLEEKE
jgi:hypothetical protein